MRLRMAVVVGACLAVLAASSVALALPGDPPITPVSPADGATVPASEEGIFVRFTCPSYRRFEGDFPGRDSYDVDLATSPELGSDGRLRSDRRVGTSMERSSNTVPAGQCEFRLGGPFGVPGPEVAPGTYFWQAYRTCIGCRGGVETGPVRRFTVRGDLRLGLEVQARGYLGYPVVASLRLGGVPNGSRAVVQRRIGSTWRRVTSVSAFRERALAVLSLPRGRQRLRVVAQVGDQRSASAQRAVSVVRARRWSTARDAGRYVGTGGGVDSALLRVTSRGREIRNFRAELTVTCFGARVEENRLLPAVAPLRRVRIAPDGRFYASSRRVELLGRVRNRRVSGTVAISYGNCSGEESFSARRR